MDKISINLNEIIIQDLNGTIYQVEDICRQIGNIIFTRAQSIEVSDLARKIHAGEEVEMTQQEFLEVQLIVSSNIYYRPFAHGQIVQYLADKYEEFVTGAKADA